MKIIAAVAFLLLTACGLEEDPEDIAFGKKIAACMRERPNDHEASSNCYRIARYERR